MNLPTPTPYDQILYPGHPFRQTHPDRLATLATLLGMHPVPIDRCRILELGCGNGANIIPMAWGLPGSAFVGIDLAARPIAEGLEIVRELGLDNIEFHQMDLIDFPETMGTFDYIIAHGLYSWVPMAVRDKLMSICRQHLAASGVAYISYNTYPGCHLRNMVREMMLFHVHRAPDAVTKIRQAQALLKFLADSKTDSNDYGRLLHKELERVMLYPDGHLFHDDLAEINDPVYFHQFMEHASSHGLQFLSEAAFFMVQPNLFPEQTVQILQGMEADVLSQQQYLDFLLCRRFRQTLLCHADVAIKHRVQPEQMADYYFSTSAKADSAAIDLNSEESMEFQGDRGSTMKTATPLAKATLQYLGSAWPASLHFKEVLQGTLNLLGREEQSEDAMIVSTILLNGLGTGLVELHVAPPRLVSEPGEYPMVSPLTRMQAAKRAFLTTLRHRVVRLDDALACRLIQLLDGSRNVATLTAQLRQIAKEMGASGTNGTKLVLSAGESGEQEVKSFLCHLAHLGLLVQ